jgi:4-amino-4-deoxy-L-arabinose transferase-like glycosyltransferase
MTSHTVAPDRPTRVTWLLLGAILLLGAVLRTVALDKVPPGLAPDEATNGYDAYSILLTGRDQHGVLLPLVMRSFNDYRMPLFIYSLVPIIGLFGLTTTAVRLGAALWGTLTIPVTFWLGTRIRNARTGLIAALLLALSPWHLPFSRMGLEITLITFTFTLSMALIWQWRVRHRARWLILASVALGATLYTYSVAKLLVPAFLGLLGLCWFEEWRRHWKATFLALSLVVLLSVPMVYMTVRYNEPMQARYEQISIFRPDLPWWEAGLESAQIFAAHFSASYLFIRGDLDTLQHPPFGGQLYWVQAPLLLLGLWALRKPQSRPALLFLLGWLILAAVPPALTKPNIPGSAHASRNLIAVIPFQLLSALGANEIWRRRGTGKGFKVMALAALGMGLCVNAGWYGGKYFTGYAPQVAHRFDDGMQAVIETMVALDDAAPVVIFSNRISWPYIYVLFFTRYDPAQLHRDPPLRTGELFAPVTKMGKYVVVGDLEQAYHEAERGLFIGPLDSLQGIPEAALISRPANGEAFCRIVRK